MFRRRKCSLFCFRGKDRLDLKEIEKKDHKESKNMLLLSLFAKFLDVSGVMYARRDSKIKILRPSPKLGEKRRNFFYFGKYGLNTKEPK